MTLHRPEEPAFAKAGGERLEQSSLPAGVGVQRIDPALILVFHVDDQDLAARVGSEAGDLQSRIRDLLLPEQPGAVVAGCPDLAGRVVAVNVRPTELRKTRAVVDNPARQRARLRVRVFESRLGERGWTQLAIQVEGVTPLVDAPAVVRPTLDEVEPSPRDPGRRFPPRYDRSLDRGSCARGSGSRMPKSPDVRPSLRRRGCPSAPSRFSPAPDGRHRCGGAWPAAASCPDRRCRRPSRRCRRP